MCYAEQVWTISWTKEYTMKVSHIFLININQTLNWLLIILQCDFITFTSVKDLNTRSTTSNYSDIVLIV